MKIIKRAAELIFIFCVVMYIFYLSGIRDINFHGDESQWIATSSVFETYVSGDFHSSIWDESHWVLTQPPLPRYYIGLGRLLCGIDNNELNAAYDWSVDYETNQDNGKVPSTRLLNCSRLSMKVLSVFSILSVYYLLKILGGYVPGVIWLMLCLISEYLPLMLGRAMGESPLLASIIFSMLTSYFLLASSNKSLCPVKMYFYFFILGGSIGLAGASKLNGFSLLAAGFLLSLIIAFRMKSNLNNKIVFFVISNLILVISSQITWIAINPYLWSSPIYRTIKMFNYRVMEMSNQVKLFPLYEINGILIRLKVITKRIFQSYASISFIGSWVINLFFFIMGFKYILIKSIKNLKNKNINDLSLVFFIVGITSSMPALITPLDWDRYYLLPIFFSTIFIAVGIWTVLRFVLSNSKIFIRRLSDKYII